MRSSPRNELDSTGDREMPQPMTRHARPCATSVRHGLCLKGCTALILLDSKWLRINWTREEIKAVQHQNIVFHGLLKHIPWEIFAKLVEQHDADGDPRGVKT